MTGAGVGDEDVEVRKALGQDVEQPGDRPTVGHIGDDTEHLLSAGQHDRMDDTASSSDYCPRATRTTLAPPPASRCPIARPMPLLPPVTTAHCPSRAGSLILMSSEHSVGGSQPEDAGRGEAAAIPTVVHTSVIGAGGEQARDRVPVEAEHVPVGVDAKSAVGERDLGGTSSA